MKQNTLIHSSILAAIFVAAVLGVSMLTGFPGAAPHISIDPISDKNTGDAFTVTGFTNLPVGTEILAQVYPASYEDRTGTGSGVFSGATGTVAVEKGTGGSNMWSFQLDTSTFSPEEYRVNVSVFAGKSGTGSVETRGPFNQTTFTVLPGSGSAGTPGSSGKAVAGGILIDPIHDTVRGRLLEVTGKTNLSAGTTLLVKIHPVSAQDGKLAADQKNIENFAAIRVEKGDGINNVFSTSFDTRFLSPADYIITISNVKGDAPDAGSEPGPFSCSQVFNIVTGTAPSGQPAADLSVPSIFINPIYDVTAGNTIMVTGTTSVPPGSRFLVSLIPESMEEATIQKNIANPKFNTTISAVRGSAKANLFSAPVPTKDLTAGQYILCVSAYEYETTGCILFTVK